AAMQQAVPIDLDPVTSSGDVKIDDAGKHGIELPTDQVVVVRMFDVLPYGFEEPQRGVRRVVLGSFSGVGEPVGQHATVGIARELQENAARDVVSAGGQRKAGQRNHGVASPVGKPGIAGDDAPGGSAGYDELIGGGCKFAGEIVVDSFDERPATLPLSKLVSGRGVGVTWLQRRDHGCLACLRQVKAQRTGIVEVLVKVE